MFPGCCIKVFHYDDESNTVAVLLIVTPRPAIINHIKLRLWNQSCGLSLAAWLMITGFGVFVVYHTVCFTITGT